MTKDEILAAVKEFNAKLGPDDDRLVLAQHPALCRCQPCWYEFGSRERNDSTKCHVWEPIGISINGLHPWQCKKCHNTTRSREMPPADTITYIDLDTGETYY